MSVDRSVSPRPAPHKTVSNLTSLVETVTYTILNLLSLVETQKMSALIGKCALTNLFSYFYYENMRLSPYLVYPVLNLASLIAKRKDKQ